jgi:hypothetical protein
LATEIRAEKEFEPECRLFGLCDRVVVEIRYISIINYGVIPEKGESTYFIWGITLTVEKGEGIIRLKP